MVKSSADKRFHQSVALTDDFWPEDFYMHYYGFLHMKGRTWQNYSILSLFQENGPILSCNTLENFLSGSSETAKSRVQKPESTLLSLAQTNKQRSPTENNPSRNKNSSKRSTKTKMDQILNESLCFTYHVARHSFWKQSNSAHFSPPSVSSRFADCKSLEATRKRRVLDNRV